MRYYEMVPQIWPSTLKILILQTDSFHVALSQGNSASGDTFPLLKPQGVLAPHRHCPLLSAQTQLKHDFICKAFLITFFPPTTHKVKPGSLFWLPTMSLV